MGVIARAVLALGLCLMIQLPRGWCEPPTVEPKIKPAISQCINVFAGQPGSKRDVTCKFQLKNYQRVVKIGKLIGEGGFGQIWTLLNLKDRKDAYIMKIVNDEQAQGAQEAEGDDGMKVTPGQALLMEYNAMKQLREQNPEIKIPNVVSYVTSDDNKVHGLIMEYLDNVKDLNRMPEKNGISLQSFDKCVQDVATTIETSTNAGFIHGDIKPRNILFQTSQDNPNEITSCWLIDWGGFNAANYGTDDSARAKDDTDHENGKQLRWGFHGYMAVTQDIYYYPRMFAGSQCQLNLQLPTKKSKCGCCTATDVTSQIKIYDYWGLIASFHEVYHSKVRRNEKYVTHLIDYYDYDFVKQTMEQDFKEVWKPQVAIRNLLQSSQADAKIGLAHWSKMFYLLKHNLLHSESFPNCKQCSA